MPAPEISAATRRPRLVAIHHRDARPAGGGALGARLADARAAAGDQDDLVLEVSGHQTLSTVQALTPGAP